MRILVGITLLVILGCEKRGEIPYVEFENWPVMEITVNDHSVRCLIDSGDNTHCSVSPELAEYLQLKPIKGVQVTSRAISGDVQNGWIADGYLILNVGNVKMTIRDPYVIGRRKDMDFPQMSIGYPAMKKMNITFDYSMKRLVIVQ